MEMATRSIQLQFRNFVRKSTTGLAASIRPESGHQMALVGSRKRLNSIPFSYRFHFRPESLMAAAAITTGETWDGRT